MLIPGLLRGSNLSFSADHQLCSCTTSASKGLHTCNAYLQNNSGFSVEEMGKILRELGGLHWCGQNSVANAASVVLVRRNW